MISPNGASPSETGAIRFGDTTIKYQVIRSHRRKKTVELTLDPTEGLLVASPMETTPDRVAEIVKKRAGWIIRTAGATMLQAEPKHFVSGESLPYLGRQVRLFVASTDAHRVSVRFHHWTFEVASPTDFDGPRKRDAIKSAFVRWYKNRSRERIGARVERWASVVGQEPGALLIRDQRQRWASCGVDGTLRFNWRTILLEPTLIDYIVVHELVHLGIRTHSSRFWDELARVMPDYRLRRQRLREAGTQLAL